MVKSYEASDNDKTIKMKQKFFIEWLALPMRQTAVAFVLQTIADVSVEPFVHFELIILLEFLHKMK